MRSRWDTTCPRQDATASAQARFTRATGLRVTAFGTVRRIGCTTGSVVCDFRFRFVARQTGKMAMCWMLALSDPRLDLGRVNSRKTTGVCVPELGLPGTVSAQRRATRSASTDGWVRHRVGGDIRPSTPSRLSALIVVAQPEGENPASSRRICSAVTTGCPHGD
jgi:hypothetical protein